MSDAPVTRWWVLKGELRISETDDRIRYRTTGTEAAQVVLAADFDRVVAALKAKLRERGACEVCWTNSWMPIEKREDADGVNTIGPDQLARCEHCWMQQAYQQREATLQQHADALAEALEATKTALDDWMNTYASELCDEQNAMTAKQRIRDNGGTLAYIAMLRRQAQAALAQYRGTPT